MPFVANLDPFAWLIVSAAFRLFFRGSLNCAAVCLLFFPFLWRISGMEPKILPDGKDESDIETSFTS